MNFHVGEPRSTLHRDVFASVYDKEAQCDSCDQLLSNQARASHMLHNCSPPEGVAHRSSGL